MKSFKQIVENIVVLDEAVMDQKMWDQTKKGDKLTISYDSGIKKGNKATFVVGTKNIVGKAKVGKITMKRDDGKGGKFFLYNRNGSISLALGDMAASMTGLVKESVEVELDERNYAKEYANYHSKPEQIANRSSRNKARRIVAKENDVDGMDVGHADNNPLNNDPANLRIENPSDNRREPRMRNEGKNSNYELYHKDFSGAMKTAYDHAKKNLGVIVDPSEIDDKVAMGPRKPSTGKTNSYRLTDKSGKKAIQVQVYNTGKSYELNMYKEDLDEAVELDEAPRRKGAPKIKPDFLKVQRAKDAEHNAAMGRTKTGRKKPVRTMTSTQKSLASMRRECAGELEEASASVYKDMPKAPGKMVSNRVQVKAFKDTNAMGAFLGKQNDNSWQQTGVAGLKSGKYKIDMVKKGGKPSKNFIKVNEEVELDEGFSPKQIEQLKKAYASMPDRLPVDAAQKMGAILKGRSKEELIAIARADIKWLSTTAATNLIMQGVKAKEING